VIEAAELLRERADAAAVRAALAGTIAEMDEAIRRAQFTNPPIPICLSSQAASSSTSDGR
jgi:hypothetical protein